MKSWIGLVLVFVLIVGAPFIGFPKGDECYHDVAARAAEYFGIEKYEYEISFVSGTLVNASGEEIEGNFNIRTADSNTFREIFVIRVKTSLSRPATIATIFHEMAHAAAYKYEVENDGYTDEQQAELLAFDAMWQTRYWWNAVHMLYLHSFFMKPSDYLTPKKLWWGAITGSRTIAFTPHAVI